MWNSQWTCNRRSQLQFLSPFPFLYVPCSTKRSWFSPTSSFEILAMFILLLPLYSRSVIHLPKHFRRITRCHPCPCARPGVLWVLNNPGVLLPYMCHLHFSCLCIYILLKISLLTRPPPPWYSRDPSVAFRKPSLWSNPSSVIQINAGKKEVEAW